jgi:hypothetical protein
MIEETIASVGKRLGRLPAKSSRKALLFSDFARYLEIPKATKFWATKAPIPNRSFGNTEMGNCTRAKQAYAIIRMERMEQRRTVEITDQEVIRAYVEMSNRRYGGGDNGAYETDALDDWRNPETTLRDVDGHAYTIDAYLRLNPFNHQEIRAALAMSSSHCLPVCLNLPLAWAKIPDGQPWTLPEGQAPIGDYLPSSWGGHSMLAFDYDEFGIWLDGTWEDGQRQVSWEAAAVYLDEAHVVVDSVDIWRKKQRVDRQFGALNLDRLVEAVNDVSSIKIATI